MSFSVIFFGSTSFINNVVMFVFLGGVNFWFGCFFVCLSICFVIGLFVLKYLFLIFCFFNFGVAFSFGMCVFSL